MNTIAHTESRIVGLDIARSLAIVLAMSSHCISAYNGGAHLPYAWLQLLFRPATPTFIILFGMMLELVYFSRLEQRGSATTQQKLLSRAIQCYVLYVVSCGVLSLREGYSAAYMVRMCLLLGATPYTDILKFYTLLFILSSSLLQLRQRWGFMPLIVLCLLFQLFHAVYGSLPYYDGFVGSEIAFGVLYGATDIVAGPSVLHGLTFVVMGMWLGTQIKASHGRHTLLSTSNPRVVALFLVCAAFLAVGALQQGNAFFSGLSSLRLRNQNSYVYFAFGVMSALLLIETCLIASATVFRTQKMVAHTGQIKPFYLLHGQYSALHVPSAKPYGC